MGARQGVGDEGLVVSDMDTAIARHRPCRRFVQDAHAVTQGGPVFRWGQVTLRAGIVHPLVFLHYLVRGSLYIVTGFD